MNKKPSGFAIIILFICLAIVGLSLLPILPVKLNPSRNLPGFSVMFRQDGSSSRVIEMDVTRKLESMLSRIKGVKSISSVSGNGYGKIDIEINKNVDLDMARFEASTIIRQTWPELPLGVSYPVITLKSPDDKSNRAFMTFNINAPSAPIIIQQYAEDNIKSVLSRISDIYKIEISGATPMEWLLEYDNEQLRILGITIDDIKTAINNYYRKEFLGVYSLNNSDNQRWIRISLLPTNDNLEFNADEIFLSGTNGRIVRLSDLVNVIRKEQMPESYYRINGLNSIYINITANENANQLQLSKEIMQAIKQIKASLPTNYEIHKSYDSTEYIDKELNKIYYRSALTIIILLLFIWIITLSLKYLLLIVISLIVNITVAITFYYLFGLEIQLYSLAGITISLNLIIDSTIVMTDHYIRRRDKKAFTSILGATLTTIGALMIIFFLEDKIRLNLQDFAAIVIINLIISLSVAFFFVPAIIDKLNFYHQNLNRNEKNRASFHHFKIRRMIVKFSKCYEIFIRVLLKWRPAVYILLILSFGIPVFMLPERIDSNNKISDLYNQFMSSPTYKKKIKPISDTYLGGSLRMFVQNVYEGSYFERNEELTLSANINQPNGSTLEQMNVLVKKMESYLSGFDEIKQFHTTIYNARRASIEIFFKKEFQKNGFPYILKAEMIKKALSLGGASWSIYGLEDQGFSNDFRKSSGSFRVKVYGYNYDNLYILAEDIKEKFLAHRRIKDVELTSEFTYWKDDYHEFYMKLNNEKMAKEEVTPSELFAFIESLFGRNILVETIAAENGFENIKILSKQSSIYDIWSLRNNPVNSVNFKYYKISDLAEISKEAIPQRIVKKNQQYQLCLQYEYIGASEQGNKILAKYIEEIEQTLPMGYTIEADNSFLTWDKNDNKQYFLILIIIIVIYFITSILFNSLKQPLSILFVVPISYIGVFLTFYWFKLNFDQGGFASFILLCGITVNSSIYILNEFNIIRKHHPKLPEIKAFVKAWNLKVIPVLLTIISTIIGFIPFMISSNKEPFWFPMAAGIIGGLIMSLIGIFLFLPAFSLNKK